MLFRHEQLFLPRAGAADIDRRENPSFRKRTVKVKLHVARSFKLFVDDVIHPGARVNERRRQNGQAAALFNVSRGTEKALRTMERSRVNPAGKRTSAWRDNEVVGPCQAGNAVHQNDNVFFVFNETHRPFKHKLRYLNVIFRHFIERRADDIARYGTFNIRYFFRSFIN